MRIKDFATDGKILKRLDTIQPLKGKWIHNTEVGSVVADLDELDMYILMNLGFSDVSQIISPNFDNYVRNVINSNQYKLDGLWKSVNFQYNPIDNYDRTETQTHNEEVNTADHETETEVGARTQTNSNGKRKQTNNNGTYTDSTTSSNSTTSFDSADYGKTTDKNIDSFTKGASTDTIETDASTDTISSNSATDKVTQKGYQDTSNGGYTLHARGNIGTMSTQNMIEQERKVVDYVFYDEILKLFERYITDMNYNFD